MKSFFVICFLAFFAFGAAEDSNKKMNISINMNMQGKIASGKVAPRHSFPYQAGLLFESENKKVWCGGCLFLPNYVLTAAHCTHKMEEVIVYLGVHNISEKTDAELTIKVPKSHFTIHRQWKINHSDNDIALIRLPSAIKLSRKIQIINLPPRSLTESKLEGVRVTASGWGRFTDRNQYHSHVLRYIHLKVTSELRCKLHMRSYAPSTHICTKGFHHGRPICVGDPGGPLVLEESNGSKTIVGVTSYGNSKGCGIGGPLSFTRITSYLDWISSHTGLPVRNN